MAICADTPYIICANELGGASDLPPSGGPNLWDLAGLHMCTEHFRARGYQYREEKRKAQVRKNRNRA